jgi:hypothetical protein
MLLLVWMTISPITANLFALNKQYIDGYHSYFSKELLIAAKFKWEKHPFLLVKHLLSFRYNLLSGANSNG